MKDKSLTLSLPGSSNAIRTEISAEIKSILDSSPLVENVPFPEDSRALDFGSALAILIKVKEGAEWLVEKLRTYLQVQPTVTEIALGVKEKSFVVKGTMSQDEAKEIASSIWRLLDEPGGFE